jgi:hypothetical protein
MAAPGILTSYAHHSLTELQNKFSRLRFNLGTIPLWRAEPTIEGQLGQPSVTERRSTICLVLLFLMDFLNCQFELRDYLSQFCLREHVSNTHLLLW